MTSRDYSSMSTRWLGYDDPDPGRTIPAARAVIGRGHPMSYEENAKQQRVPTTHKRALARPRACDLWLESEFM